MASDGIICCLIGKLDVLRIVRRAGGRVAAMSRVCSMSSDLATD
jgi:hypothetical protein